MLKIEQSSKLFEMLSNNRQSQSVQLFTRDRLLHGKSFATCVVSQINIFQIGYFFAGKCLCQVASRT